MKKYTTISSDILGISTALLCLIHCLLFPLLTVLPFGFSENIWIDIVFALIGTFTVLKILFSNSNNKVKVILSISLLFILISIIINIIYGLHNELILLGGLGMIVGHILNFKNHKH